MALTDFKVLIAISAAILSGIWGFYLFVAERNHLPKLEINITAECAKYDVGMHIVYAKVTLTNIGKTAIKPTQGQVKLQQISPPFDNNSVDPNGYNYLSPQSTEILWPLIGERSWEWRDGDFLLEPGESDELDVDFVVFDSLELVRLYGYINNPITKTGGWSNNYTFEVKGNCNTNTESRSKGEAEDEK